MESCTSNFQNTIEDASSNLTPVIPIKMEASSTVPRENAANASAPTNVSVSRKVLNAIKKLQGRQGVSLVEVKKYLKESKKMDIKDLIGPEILMAVKNGLKKGSLIKEEGKYKIKEAPQKKNNTRTKATKAKPRAKSQVKSSKRGRATQKKRQVATKKTLKKSSKKRTEKKQKVSS